MNHFLNWGFDVYGKRNGLYVRKIVGDNYIYYGEVNRQGYKHGRSICMSPNGWFRLGYYKNGSQSTGYFVRILFTEKGSFSVGEVYSAPNGELKHKGSDYREDGATRKFDY